MNRRDFLKTAAVAGASLAFGIMPPAAALKNRAQAGEIADSAADLVAVRNGQPGQMFDHGINAMGGMGRFVKPGQSVVIKPNVSWESVPELGGCTNPELVATVIKRCFDAGASRVTVVDHNIENGRRCYEVSGISSAATGAGATVAPAEAERYYAARPINGISLKNPAVHEAILEADVFINMPVLKHHGGAGMTAALKNLMGAVWDRRFYHGNNLHQCIADFLHVRKPDLNIVDCYRILTRHGPRGGSPQDVRLAKMQLLSTDIVAVDAASAKLMNATPESYGHIMLAHAAGFGEIDPARLASKRITL